MASLNDVKTCFESVNTANIDGLIKTIKLLLRTHKPMPSDWKNFIESGEKFLSYVNERGEQFGDTVDLFKSSSHVLEVVSDIVEAVGSAHWALTPLSIIGLLLTKAVQMAENRELSLELLQDMLDLAEHINKLRGQVGKGEEKLANALEIIVKGFVKSSLDSKNLSSLRSEISALYPDLTLTAVIATMQQLPQRLPVKQPERPAGAVGLIDREEEVMKLLKMNSKDKELRVVVIYGIGGMGKTHLANCVYPKLDLEGYTCCRIVMDSDSQKNEIKKMQEQILTDAFPNYNSGRAVDLRNKLEGREKLKTAFQKAGKPVFLFIDNVLRAEELEELLPTGLGDLGKHIRILLTARTLAKVRSCLFKKNFVKRYVVEPLSNADAKKLLSNETDNLIDNKNVTDIQKICKGMPLALKIVGAELEKQEYNMEKCGEILNALQTGKEIKADDLCKRLVDFVYSEFEEFTQEAFLDICCFFDGINRTLVESSVGSEALKALEDAALITIKQEPDPMKEYEETVVVHDVIKARGQKLAELTRIRDLQSFENAKEDKRLKDIKGIELWCNKDHSLYILEKEDFNSMSKSLRVLKLGPNIKVRHEAKKEFPELRYAYLDHNISFVPFNSLNNLSKLAVYIGPLLTGGVSIYKLPEKLIQISTFQSARGRRSWDEPK